MRKDNLLFLRRLHGIFYEWKKKTQKQYRFKRSFVSSNGKKVYIIGTPEHTNLGDSAIVLAEREFLKRCGVSETSIEEITFQEYLLCKKFIKK